MIKVTIGESKPQENPFPKLMKMDYWITEVYEHPDLDGKYIGIHRDGPYKGQITLKLNLVGFTDYNEPITIQNA